MATGSLASVHEYLSTSYRPDCDYVDGVVLERSVGEKSHSRLQSAVWLFFHLRRQQWGLWPFAELRVQVSPTRFRIPDVCMTLGDPPGEIVTSPPFICVEILSPDDRLSEMRQRVDDYLSFGVPNVWILDPATRQAWRCTATGMQLATNCAPRIRRPSSRWQNSSNSSASRVYDESRMAAENPRVSHRPGRRAYLLIALFAMALVLFPFLFWYYTWFGRKLTDSDIDAYFADRSKPRHIQHALVQVGERMSQGRNASRWYPRVIGEASSPNLEIRQTAAWIMGQDRTYAPFHDALLKLVHDPQPMVRRNAALSLAAFGDPLARPELVAMLHPFSVHSPVAGVVHYRLKLGDYVNPGTLLAHIGETEVRSPAPGEVRSLEKREGEQVAAGDPLVELSVDKNHVWEALRGLYLVGRPEDLEDVERFVRPVPGLPESVARQANLTAQAIQAKAKQ